MAETNDREYPQLPQVAVGAVTIRGDRVLLVKRGRPPSQGLWAVPGGRVELGETLQQAAQRETLEETGVQVEAGEPVYTFDAIIRDEERRVKYHYVIIDLKAEYVAGEIHEGDDAAAVAWVPADRLDSLPVNEKTLYLLRNVMQFAK